jgi:replicative DNA helicase
MLEMHDSGQKIDLTLLVERLKSAGDFERLGGAAFLARTAHSVPNYAHASYYAQIVREKATYRSLIDVSTEILRDAYEESSEAKLLLSNAEQKIFSILDGRSTSTVSNIREILHDAMDRIDARMRGEHAMGGVETGFTDLDELTGGLHNSELVILAARPSMGKTALAMNIAEHVSMKLLVPTLMVSLEMSSIELADRLLCSAAQVNGHRLRNGTISNDDRARLVDKAAEMSRSPLFVDDAPSRTVTEIAAAARRIRRREQRLGLIVIDYLQLIEPDNSKDQRQEQVARIARRLKGLARELEVPVLCLAQLNRQAEDSRDHKPRLSHLRESGAIEQDADVVMFVHREEYFRSGEEKEQFAGQAEIIVAKQRNGPVGDVEVLWQKEFTRFVDKAPERLQVFDDYNQQPPDSGF